MTRGGTRVVLASLVFVASVVAIPIACHSSERARNHAPATFAPCGPLACDVRASYCEIVLSDVPDPPTDYACKPLPASCLFADGAPPTCACFPKDTRCRSFCGPIATKSGPPGIHLTCRL